MKQVVTVDGRELTLTNLKKVFWPKEGYTKGQLIEYYVTIAPYLLPMLSGRPLVLKRMPDGIKGKFFYQKDCPDHAPDWVKTFPSASESQNKVIDYITADHPATLAWLANLGCIEIHAWLSTVEKPEYPTIAVFDLDPCPPAGFKDTLPLALLIKSALDQFNLRIFPKTSGASGLHLFVPIEPIHTFEEVRKATKFICDLVLQHYPEKATLEHLVKNRTGKVYLDYLQNALGKSMAWVYSLRPEPMASISCPLEWSEIESEQVDPTSFNLLTIGNRIKEKGDLYAEFNSTKQNLKEILKLAD